MLLHVNEINKALMNIHNERKTENKRVKAVSASVAEQKINGKAVQIKDNRPRSVIQQKQLDAIANWRPVNTTIQKKEDKTGLPGNLKSGIENLSGISMDDVKVYYHSDKPAQLNADAYAQGTEIHIASGQEKHLPHEAWHVVQQKQGRVKPTIQMKGNVKINDDKGLEKEADVIGGKAAILTPDSVLQQLKTIHSAKILQRAIIQLGGKSKNQRKIAKEEKAKKKDDIKTSKEEDKETYELARAGKPKHVKQVEKMHLAKARKEFEVDRAKAHIINRHSPRSKKPGKTLFPVGWDDEKILNAITQVIVNASTYIRSTDKYGKSIRGYFDGILIEVFFMPSSIEDEFVVSTAYPLKGQDGIQTNPGKDEDD